MTTVTGIEAIEKTVHKTNEWLKEIDEELGSDDRHLALQCLRAVLHSLRDRLPLQEAADLGSQLPLLVRGLYYENFNPISLPVKDRKLGNFLEHIRIQFPSMQDIDPERSARVVFRVLKRHVTEGEIQDVLSNMPRGIQPLWNG